MYCPNCGAENPDEAQFCRSCGHRFTKGQEEPPKPEEPEKSPADPPPPPPPQPEPEPEPQPAFEQPAFDGPPVGAAPAGPIGETLTIGGVISNGFSLGMKYAASLIGAFILWAITIWIPYLNVGTTIGLMGGMVVAMAKGEPFSPTSIFKKEYRHYIGEFFLLIAFLYIGVVAGTVFLVIPGIVIAVAWSQALPLLLDRKLTPLQCLHTSNNITYGQKWSILLGLLLLYLIVMVVVLVLGGLLGQVSEALAGIVGLIGVILLVPIMMGGSAYVYRVLSKNIPD